MKKFYYNQNEKLAQSKQRSSKTHSATLYVIVKHLNKLKGIITPLHHCSAKM